MSSSVFLILSIYVLARQDFSHPVCFYVEFVKVKAPFFYKVLKTGLKCVCMFPPAESGHHQRVPWCPVPVPSAGSVSARSAEWFQPNVALQRYAVKTLQLSCIVDGLPVTCILNVRTVDFQRTQPEYLKALVSWRPGWWVGSTEIKSFSLVGSVR